MPATIIDGKALADRWLGDIAEQVRAMHAPLHLAAVCVGGDEGVRAFVRVKQKAAQSVGVQFSSYLFGPGDVHQAKETLRFLANDDSVHGVFIELPLPEGWDRDALVSLIPASKDVDALTSASPVVAPSVRALRHVLREYDIEPRGLHAAVVGHGSLVGVPIARWLKEAGAVVDIVDIGTPQPTVIARAADIIVAGVGKPGLVTGEWIKEGTTVIDFGYARSTSSGEAQYVGDVDFNSVQKKAGLLTPVPGGMGPLVVAAVLENLLELATSSL